MKISKKTINHTRVKQLSALLSLLIFFQIPVRRAGDAERPFFNLSIAALSDEHAKGARVDFEGSFAIDINGDGTIRHQPGRPSPLQLEPKLLWIYDASAVIKWFDRWEDGFCAGDLNNDGIADIVFGTAAGDAIAVNGKNGDLLWSFPVPNATESVNVDIVDINNDGGFNVVAGGKAVTGKAVLVALNSDGSLVWQNQIDYNEITDLAFGDMDGDGKTDIAVSGGTYSHAGGQIVFFDGASGNRIADISLGSGIAFGIDTKNIDSDPDWEIAVTNYDNKVFLIDSGGDSILWSKAGIYYGRDVIIEDIDHDSDYEVISVMGNVYCYDHEGNIVWSIPSGVGENLQLMDWNKDDKAELLIANPWEGRTSLVNPVDGAVIWTQTESGAADIGDLNGDGNLEIVTGSLKYYTPDFPKQYLRAFSGDNQLLLEYELPEEMSSVAAVNIDTDIEDEILVATGSTLKAFDVVPQTAVAPLPERQHPDGFMLYPIFPNPFNTSAIIRYYLPEQSAVRISVINALGREIETLLNTLQTPGKHTLQWTPNHVPSGVYWIVLENKGMIQVQKILFLK